MSKHILILTGSPRQGGNSDLMADAFIRGAESAGHQVTKIQTAQLKINGCTACECCYSSGGKACVQNDDFNQVAQAMEQADCVLHAHLLVYLPYIFKSSHRQILFVPYWRKAAAYPRVHAAGLRRNGGKLHL